MIIVARANQPSVLHIGATMARSHRICASKRTRRLVVYFIFNMDLFPRRETTAAKCGPRLEVSPTELSEITSRQHGITEIISASKAWEPFAWKGNNLSMPTMTLYSAETNGLLNRNGGRATDVRVDEITNHINEYFASIGKNPISTSTVLTYLRVASQWANIALGITIVCDRKNLTVRLLDQHETKENIQRYFEIMNPKIKKLNAQLTHAKKLGYKVENYISLEGAELAENIKALAPSAN